MKLIFSPLAEKQLKKFTKVAQVAIAVKVRNLRDGNFVNTKRLSGHKDLFRSRAGNYRVIFKQSSNNIYGVLLGHRKEVYKILERLKIFK